MPTPAPMIVGLGDRRVDHALGAEALLQALVLAEDAAAADVFAEHDHARVGFASRRRSAAAARPARSVISRHWPAPVVCTSV